MTRNSMFKVMILLLLFVSGCTKPTVSVGAISVPTTPTPLPPMPHAEPTPDYLVVFPRPGSVLTTTEYSELGRSIGWSDGADKICVGVNPGEVMEPGDLSDGDRWLSTTHLVVDGLRVDKYDSVLKKNLSGREYRDKDTGELLYKAPDGSPFSVCYDAELTMGRHTVSYVIQQTSGNILEYTWYFEIVE